MILASASPRRAAILEALGLSFEVDPPRVPELLVPGEAPVDHARRLSREKVSQVAGRHPGRWVLGGDTLVTLDGDILGKPRDRGHAVEMLLRLQGRTHYVISSLTLLVPVPCAPAEGSREPALRTGAQETAVTFRAFGREAALAYVETGEPDDKAGAYGIQGRGAVLVERIEGDYSNVVGLPIPLLLDLLEAAGRPYRFGGRPAGP